MGVPLADVTESVVGPGAVEVSVQHLLGGAFASQVCSAARGGVGHLDEVFDDNVVAFPVADEDAATLDAK